MNLTLRVWRQKGSGAGKLVTYPAKDVSPDSSFLEMLDQVNQELVTKGEEPIAFDSDCREGICGTCSMVINGIPHGPQRGTTACQLHMRVFKDGDTITIEPFRAKAFPVVKDLVVDRSAFDRVQQAGGYVSVNTGAAPDGNAIPIPKPEADVAFDAAACIGCGACVAACKNSSAMLFLSAKLAQYRHLPQGQPERVRRTVRMVEAADREGFGNCTNFYECEAVCPKNIPARFIAEMNVDYIKSALISREFDDVNKAAEDEG
ncbi:MAG TPA: succinate dehydrogenase/fumarate reductase iron-sulfur subunit [Pseudomonadota bacterium]|jgi:succinate dehydrogenase / fumarate reductase iron-sulfur subunit|nr:succinate dehydrogenase/fumarate reductase iron-sulfur subunit [Pseudomonadota bacterium]HNN50980.1 succinate dehydrogenase/fumarate reductase iron-sulfur subunit [Pseudomonadota bacterium]